SVGRLPVLQRCSNGARQAPSSGFHAVKERLHPIQPRGLARVVALAAGLQRLLELPEQLLLLAGEVHGRLHHDVAEHVAGDLAAHRFDALAAQAELLAALGFRRNLQRHAAVQRRHLHLAAERGRGEADRHIAMQVAALAAEDRMRPDPHFHVQVARRTAILSRLAFAGEANAVAGVHAGGNLYRQGADFLLAAAAAAVRARFRDHGAGAMALGAGLLDGEETLLHADLAGAAAGLRRAAGAAARAAATVAGGHARHADLDGVAEDRLFQVEHHFVAQVGAAEDAPSAPPAAAAEDVAEDVPENVAKVGAAEP